MALTRANGDVLSVTDISKLLRTDATIGGIKEYLDAQISSRVPLTGGVTDNALKWSGSTKTVSLNAPSGGVDGDIWFQYE